MIYTKLADRAISLMCIFIYFPSIYIFFQFYPVCTIAHSCILQLPIPIGHRYPDRIICEQLIIIVK